jgi:hypothetical protein
MTKKLDKTTSPAGTKITANSVKTKDVDKLLTAANTIDLHDVEPGEQIAVALILTRIGESYGYDTVGSTKDFQIIGTEKVHVYKATGVAFVTIDEVRDVVAVMAMKILEDEEQRKNGGQQRLPIDEDPDGHHDDER